MLRKRIVLKVTLFVVFIIVMGIVSHNLLSLNAKYSNANTTNQNVELQIRNHNYIDNKSFCGYEMDKDMERARRIKILCWILCDPSNLHKVYYSKITWMKHCDLRLFMSSVENKTFPTVGLNVPRGRAHIGLKAREAWKYLYTHYQYDFDYFIKADPDTYMIVRNMKAYLSHRDPTKAEAMGHLFRLMDKGRPYYFSGGPGEILSRGALRALNEIAFAHNESCLPDGSGEDVQLGRCLHIAGVEFVDTRDSHKRETMLVYPYSNITRKALPRWYRFYDQHETKTDSSCCSVYPISIHYVQPESMLDMDYYFQQVHADNDSAICTPANHLKFYEQPAKYKIRKPLV